jgi:hypothetical protein
MTKPVVVRSSSVEAAKLLMRRNAERGKTTDSETSRLAKAKFVPAPLAKPQANGAQS